LNNVKSFEIFKSVTQKVFSFALFLCIFIAA
jgi:hypothetical protein